MMSNVSGLVTIETDRGFDQTVAEIEQRIEESPLTHISTFDHTANAESVNLELPPTTVLLFGNPQIGTQLMDEGRTIGIDLPQKILVWEESDTVCISYNDSQYLATRHGIENKDDLFQQSSMAVEYLATGEETSGDGKRTER